MHPLRQQLKSPATIPHLCCGAAAAQPAMRSIVRRVRVANAVCRPKLWMDITCNSAHASHRHAICNTHPSTTRSTSKSEHSNTTLLVKTATPPASALTHPVHITAQSGKKRLHDLRNLSADPLVASTIKTSCADVSLSKRPTVFGLPQGMPRAMPGDDFRCGARDRLPIHRGYAVLARLVQY